MAARTLSAGYLALLLLPAQGSGQILLRWPVRASPWPEALLSGGAAALWNPAGITGVADGRAEVWIAHVNGPDPTGLKGLAVTATGELPWIGPVAAAYQHLGVGDIPRTGVSPSAEGPDVGLGEDLFSFVLARTVRHDLALGVAVRYDRAGHQERTADRVTADVGVRLLPALPFLPRLAVMLRDLPQEPGWLAGVEMAMRERVNRAWTARVAYGAADRFEDGVFEHRIAVGASWWRRFHAEFGLGRTNGDSGWTTLWMLGAEFGRYSVAVLREELPNDFGVALQYRFSMELP